MAADWKLTINDATTGKFIRELAPTGDSPWSASLSGDGASTNLVKVDDADEPWKPSQIAEMFAPNTRLICRWWGDACMYAHKIDDWEYDRDAGVVAVSAVDLSAEAAWRMVGGVTMSKDAGLTVVNRSASGAFAAVLGRMMQWGPEWEYPIDLPADGSGGITETWPFWKKFRISDIIQQIKDRTGYEFYLRPYQSAPDRSIRFQTRVARTITIGATSFILGADETPLAGVRYRVSGKRQITGLLGVGNGSGYDQATASAMRAEGEPLLIPIRDTKQTFPDLTGSALQEATTEFFQANRAPIVQWSIGSFTIGNLWSPGRAAPGHVWNITSIGDPVIPDSVHRMRVIKVSGDNTRVMKTEVQSA